MVPQRIPVCTIATDDRDLVTVFFVFYLDHVVMSENSLSTPILQLDSQRHLICCGDTINFVVSQPEILGRLSDFFWGGGVGGVLLHKAFFASLFLHFQSLQVIKGDNRGNI